MTINEGSKVIGSYYNDRYSGIVRKIRSYYGNDASLFNYNVIYINLDTPIKGWDGPKTSICLDPMSQKCGYVTIHEMEVIK
jgi:hypothetical protein